MKTVQDEELNDNGSVIDSQMSFATKRYDLSGKGYLDQDEKIIRKYDKDNDGVFTLEEAKSMAADLRGAIMSKDHYRKLLIGCGGLLIVSWAGNFGLTYATVALTTQVNSQDGDLTDTSGKIVATKPKGDAGYFFPEFSSDTLPNLRHLSGSEILFGTVSTTRVEAKGIWSDHTKSIPTSVIYDLDGAQHASSVHLVSQQLDVSESETSGTCDVYADVTVEPNPNGVAYKLKCCGADNDPCDVYTEVPSGTRALGPCFSPMSTVIEKTKGKMFIKDLQFGDSVLAANKVYQSYVLDIHSHSSKPTEFVQIHTEESSNGSNNAAIELTSGHMIFIDGKDTPILAGEVKLGDSLIGMDGYTKVTKITTIMRDGHFDPLTADATLYVDGILASSMVDANEFVGRSSPAANTNANYLNFGFFKVHIHTFMSRAIAPLFHSLCTKVDSKHCETQVDDGYGGSRNILLDTGRVVLNLHPLSQGLLLLLLPAAGATSLIAYYIFMVLSPIAFVLGIFMAYTNNQSSQSKCKLA